MVGLSIIICTRDRPDSLRLTLRSIFGCSVPRETQAELVIVDNGNLVETAAVAREFASGKLPARYVKESRQGLCHARNRGIAESSGDILLYTDDDVIVPAGWIEGMCRPILVGEGDAVAGGIRIPHHLVRPWMTMRHRLLLTTTEHMSPEHVDCMTGANMAFARKVLSRVPLFDPELDAGALGYMGETLFAKQLLVAGYRIASGLHVIVDHHFSPSRLTRAFFLDAVRNAARSRAYFAYHWEHASADLSLRLLFERRVRLFGARMVRRRQIRRVLIPKWEQDRLYDVHYQIQFAKERLRPRLYDQFGLVKRTSPSAGSECARLPAARTYGARASPLGHQ